MQRRILSILIILIALLAGPFWLSGAFVLAAIIYFDNFYEACILLLIFDLAYGISEPKFFHIKIPFFLLSIPTVFFIQLAKKKFKFYK